MEQQNKITAPPESFGKRFWQLWGPLFIKGGIAFIVMIVAGTICSSLYMTSHYDVVMKAMESQEEMAKLYMVITEQLLKSETFIQGAAALATIPVMMFFFHRDRTKEKAAGFIPNKKAPAWKYSAQLIMALALSFGLNNLIEISGLANLSEGYEETMNFFYVAPFPAQIVCLGILVPICEELVFRGLMFKRLRMRTSFLSAAFFSSVVFGIMHGNLVQMLYGCLLGMMLAYVYEKYGSVLAPIAAHIVMNLFSVVATKYQVIDWLAADFMRIGIATILCGTVAATMFVWIQRIEEKPDIPNKPEDHENLAAV